MSLWIDRDSERDPGSGARLRDTDELQKMLKRRFPDRTEYENST